MATNTVKSVGDYITLQRGKTYSGKLVGEPGPALLGLGSIEPGGGFRAANYKTFGGDCPPNLMLSPGDIYVALKGATKDGSMVGSVARLPAGIPSGRLTQDTARLDFRDTDPEVKNHVYWVLRTPQYRQYCAGRLTGSAAASFSRDDFLSYPVPPVTGTSRTLVELLEAAEAKIELNRRMSATLEAMARSLFKSWFVDFDPVRAKVEGRGSGLRADLDELFPASFTESNLGTTPSGWKVCPLSEQTDLERGISYTGAGLSDHGMPMHNLNSVHEGGGYKYGGIKHYVGDYRERHRVLPGDCIVVNTEQGRDRMLIGHAAIVPATFGPDGLFSHHLYRIRPKAGSSLTPQYLCHLLNDRLMHDLVSGYSNGTTVNMLPADALKSPVMAVPPEGLVRVFDNHARNTRARIELTISESATLAHLRDTLLPKLISGELRMTDAEHIAVEAGA